MRRTPSCKAQYSAPVLAARPMETTESPLLGQKGNESHGSRFTFALPRAGTVRLSGRRLADDRTHCLLSDQKSSSRLRLADGETARSAVAPRVRRYGLVGNVCCAPTALRRSSRRRFENRWFPLRMRCRYGSLQTKTSPSALTRKKLSPSDGSTIPKRRSSKHSFSHCQTTKLGSCQTKHEADLYRY